MLKSILANWPLCFSLCSILLAPCFPAQAQQPTKIPRWDSSLLPLRRLARPASRLFDRGYASLAIEGKNIVIEYRYAEGKFDRLPALASDLVRLKVDVIVPPAVCTTRAAKEASAVVPVVMTQDIDPVANGFIASLARPGGNITGLSHSARR